MSAWPRLPVGIAYGGDYNPEQWPRETWLEDVRLMREAGVTLVTVGVFSWALLEPAEGEFELDWLADVLDLLHDNGIAVDLATATASPPPWLSTAHPETLPRRADGTTLWPGGRQAWCPSSPVFRERALALVTALAERFHDHPALVMWHVSNELGGHNAHCYCDVSAADFRAWLERRYATLEALNDAWGTAFWSQRYTAWEQVLPPRTAPTFPNPTQQLDFARFSSDALLAHFCAERDVLHRLSPGVPVTTNFMVMEHVRNMDYFAWAPQLDVVSQRPLPDGRRPRRPRRAVLVGRPHPRSRGRRAVVADGALDERGELAAPQRRQAAGPDAAQQPGPRRARLRRGLLLPVAGRRAPGPRSSTPRWCRTPAPTPRSGARSSSSAPCSGRSPRSPGRRSAARSRSSFDWDARWAAELDSHPSADVTYLDRHQALYRALWDAGVTTDMVAPDADLSGYRLVLVPTLYLTTDADAENLTRYVESGGTALVTYWSGIVDENDHVRLGGYPGAYRDLLGIRTEEFYPLREDERVRLADGVLDGRSADVWTELLTLRGAEAVSSYADGPLPGVPALTRHTAGGGTAWYLATRVDAEGTAALVRHLCASTGIADLGPAGCRDGPPHGRRDVVPLRDQPHRCHRRGRGDGHRPRVGTLLRGHSAGRRGRRGRGARRDGVRCSPGSGSPTSSNGSGRRAPCASATSPRRCPSRT